jgi:hypothetical protein
MKKMVSKIIIEKTPQCCYAIERKKPPQRKPEKRCKNGGNVSSLPSNVFGLCKSKEMKEKSLLPPPLSDTVCPSIASPPL